MGLQDRDYMRNRNKNYTKTVNYKVNKKSVWPQALKTSILLGIAFLIIKIVIEYKKSHL